MKYMRHGFTMIELVVVLAVVSGLIGLAVLNIHGVGQTAVLSGTVDTLTSDIKSQQGKAMSGALTGGVVPAGYGIKFFPNQYVLFQGLVYNAGDITNSTFPLDARLTFSSVNLPNASLVFSSGSGELVNYAAASSSMTIMELDNSATETFQFNRYGVITKIQ